MTPKEKAGELYFKYHNLWINGNSIIAKQCALIAVNEILNQIIRLTLTGYAFWDEVKKEIEKL